jgi:hypothetical protein
LASTSGAAVVADEHDPMISAVTSNNGRAKCARRKVFVLVCRPHFRRSNSHALPGCRERNGARTESCRDYRQKLTESFGLEMAIVLRIRRSRGRKSVALPLLTREELRMPRVTEIRNHRWRECEGVEPSRRRAGAIATVLKVSKISALRYAIMR